VIKIKNQDQLKRVMRGLAETNSLIDKEKSYSINHQNLKYLAGLETHKEKLERAIKDFFPLPIIELNENSKRLLARALKGNP
jgi:hypothetical protein